MSSTIATTKFGTAISETLSTASAWSPQLPGRTAAKQPSREADQHREPHGGGGQRQGVRQHLQHHRQHRTAAHHVGAEIEPREVAEIGREPGPDGLVEPHLVGEGGDGLGRRARAEQDLRWIAGDEQREQEQQRHRAEQHGGGADEARGQARVNCPSSQSSPFGSTAGASQSRKP